MKTLDRGRRTTLYPRYSNVKTFDQVSLTKRELMLETIEKKTRKTVKIKSRYVVKTDTTSLCLLNKPTYRQHFRGRRSFNYAKHFSVFNQEI